MFNKIKSLGIQDSRNLLFLERLVNNEQIDESMDKTASEKYSIPYQIKQESSFQMKYLDNQKRKKIIETLGIGELK